MAFFSDQFLRGVLFFAVGGVSSVAILKIWENRESLLREIRKRFDSNETRQPEEHDERFDWEGKSSVSYENILSKSDRLMVISEKLCDACKPWLFRQRRGNPFLRANSPSWSSWADLIFIIIFLFFLFTLKKLVIFPIVVRATYSETKRQKMQSKIILIKGRFQTSHTSACSSKSTRGWKGNDTDSEDLWPIYFLCFYMVS